MGKRLGVVVTTIGDGSFVEKFRRAIEADKVTEETSLIVIPDRKSPPSLYEACRAANDRGLAVQCPSIEQQEAFLDGLGRMRHLVPYNSDNRRNVGYLMALAQGTDIVVSMDDDNLPVPGTPFVREQLVVGTSVTTQAMHSSDGFYNICELLDVEPGTTHARGFPYRYRFRPRTVTRKTETGPVHINAGLWLGHPDVDAVSCLAAPVRSKAFKGQSVLLGRDTWSPINSQNTALTREAVASYYFLRMGFPVAGLTIDRDGDIFSGYFAQACARKMGGRVRVGTPVVNHERNVHNYLKDLQQELACILLLEDVTDWLRTAELDGRTYAETYASLAAALEHQAPRFEGPVWNEASRGFLHAAASWMRAWVEAIDRIGAAR